jgi:predicted metal-dependent phosphoesterase TrpH
MLKADFHLHTADDPQDDIPHDGPALVERAAALGFDALAITLHDRQFEDARLSDYARERGVLLIPGIERTIRGYHVLLLNFAAQATHAVRTLDDLASLKRSGCGLVIAPHPFFPDLSCVGSALDGYADVFDAVEWSYFWTRTVNFNARAGRWAHRYDRAVVGNSDLHDLRQLGRTYSLVDAPADAAAICDAVRAGRVRLCTSPTPALELSDVLLRMLLRPRKKTAESDMRSRPSLDVVPTP